MVGLSSKTKKAKEKLTENVKDAGRKAKEQVRKSLEQGRQFYLNADDALSRTSLGKTPLTMKGRTGKVKELVPTGDRPEPSKPPPVPALPSSLDPNQKSEKKKQTTSQLDSDSIRREEVSDQAPPSRPPSKDRTSTHSRDRSKGQAGKSHRNEPTQGQLEAGSWYVEASDNSPVDESDEAPSAPRPLIATDRSSTQRPSSRGRPGPGQSTNEKERRRGAR